MRLTVCIPHYRSIDSLRRVLEALNRQEVQSLELRNDVKILVVNDDLVIKLNKEDYIFDNLNLGIINKVNQGPATTRNVGIEEAAGRFIFFLDADSVPAPNWLEVMLKSIESDPTVMAVGGQVQPMPTRGIVNEYYNITNRLRTPIFDKHTGEIVTIITANCGFKLDALRDVGGFDSKNFYGRRPGGEDVDLTYRLKQRGYKLKYESDAIIFHEYPKTLLSIFIKNSNYGWGMKVFCRVRGIDPQFIRQPRLGPLPFFTYCLQIFNKTKQSFVQFKEQTTMSKAIAFTSFDIIRNFAYTYGYFFKN